MGRRASFLLLFLLLPLTFAFDVHYPHNHPFGHFGNQSGEEIIFIITPTHSRPLQLPQLIRMTQTLSLVPRLHWILAEDSLSSSSLVHDFLFSSGVWRFSHVHVRGAHHLKQHNSPFKHHRGVEQRNLALEVVMERIEKHQEEGVVYFLDDDNIVSLNVFPELRAIKEVGYMPVGQTGRLYERCVMNKNKLMDIRTGWRGRRVFPVDMLTFGTRTGIMKKYKENTNRNPAFSLKWKIGRLEEGWISQFKNNLGEIEPLAQDCKHIYGWHTRVQKPTA